MGKYYVRFGNDCWVDGNGGTLYGGSYCVGDRGAMPYSSLTIARDRAAIVGGEVVRRISRNDYTYEVA